MSSSMTRPLAGLALAASLAAGLFAAAPAQAAPLTPVAGMTGAADTGIVNVQYGYGRHHHRHWGHRHHGWGHRHHGWGHRHHGWGHRHHGWGHRHHGWGHRHRW